MLNDAAQAHPMKSNQQRPSLSAVSIQANFFAQQFEDVKKIAFCFTSSPAKHGELTKKESR